MNRKKRVVNDDNTKNIRTITAPTQKNANFSVILWMLSPSRQVEISENQYFHAHTFLQFTLRYNFMPASIKLVYYSFSPLFSRIIRTTTTRQGIFAKSQNIRINDTKYTPSRRNTHTSIYSDSPFVSGEKHFRAQSSVFSFFLFQRLTKKLSLSWALF